jgi:hypothetical protein
MRTPDLSRESGNDLPQQNKNQIEKPPHMKKWYKVTIKATITKTQDIHATSQAVAEQEAMELFNPHSGERNTEVTTLKRSRKIPKQNQSFWKHI